MEILTKDNLEELIQNNDKVVVQFGAKWCGMCRVMKPKFERLSKENPDALFVYVDAEELPNSREVIEIANLPTFASFSNGKLAKQFAGSKEEQLLEVINATANN